MDTYAKRESREDTERMLNPITFRKEVIDGLLENFENRSVAKKAAIPKEFLRLKRKDTL